MSGNPRASRSRVVSFAIVCVVAIGGALGYGWLRTRSSDDVPATLAFDAHAVAAVAARSHVIFRNTALGPDYGRVSLIPLADLGGPRAATGLVCERVHFAAGTGLCLAASRGVITSYRADVFDQEYAIRRSLPLAGIPSRARVAPDGSLVAFTSFVSGDSYAAAGFSTRTLLVDAREGRSLGDLEEFAVSRNGERFQSVDFNFWGVTFAQRAAGYFATLSTGGRIHLVEGDAASRTMRTIREGIECPALSPDNARIAFKKRQPGMRVLWRIHVLDLASGIETPLAETRSVDDQVEWLDGETVIYALPRAGDAPSPSMDVWSVPADGSGAPSLLLRDAESPAVVRR